MNIYAMTYDELGGEIILDDSLLAKFDEQKLLNRDYSLGELQSIVHNWILESPDA